MDSGLGGLPYGYFFHSRNKNEKLICVGDRANFPYGLKSKEALIGIMDALTERLVPLYDPKMLALVCNTASVTTLDFLREKYPDIPVVGTVPAIKPAVTASKTRRVGVIGTLRTVEDPLIQELAGRYGPDCEIIGIAASDLVEFAQCRYGESTQAERLGAVVPYVEKFRSSGVDSIVLGCTHFLLLRDDFLKAAGKDMGIYDSVEGVSRRVESIMDNDGGELRARPGDEQTPTILVTGEAPLESYWGQLASSFGFILEKDP